MNATELFDELRAYIRVAGIVANLQPFEPRPPLACGCPAKSIEIRSLSYRQSSKPRTRRRPDPLEANWRKCFSVWKPTLIKPRESF